MPERRSNSRNGHEQGTTKQLGGTIIELVKNNKEVLASAAVSAAGAAAAGKAPQLVRRLVESTESRGEQEASRLGEKAAEGAKKEIGGNSGVGKALKALTGARDGKKTRRLPIQRWTDVTVPVEKAYQAWTKFEDYPKFMHRVLSVERRAADRVRWQEKIWFSKRQWEGRITERRSNDRIVWRTTSGMSHKGIVSFHKLDTNLTRVMVEIEFEPNGIVEKLASGLRFVKRAVQADLARFKAYVEMDDAKGIEYRSASDADDETRRADQRASKLSLHDLRERQERRERHRRARA
jgi:uncharacterized membrane protein